jgi:hypothetical protein
MAMACGNEAPLMRLDLARISIVCHKLGNRLEWACKVVLGWEFMHRCST